MESIVKNIKFFVIFSSDTPYRRWWNVFLKKPFWHSFIMVTWSDGFDNYVYFNDPVVELLTHKLYFREEKPNKIAHWFSYLRDYRECHKNIIGVYPKILQTHFYLDKQDFGFKLQQKIPLCTTLIKRFLGINSWSITPKQLYKLLRRRGCKEIFKS